jgi:hypothetical protein
MGYKTIKVNTEVEVVDIPTMGEMNIDDYKDYLDEGLFFVDHHSVLRSLPAGYPIAVTKTQFKALVDYIKSLESKVGVD